MKAAVVERPHDLVVRDLSDPEPGPYDALCRMLYGATCAGTDRHIIKGRFPFPCIDYPTILGHESIGRVVEVGAKVRNYKAGDLITRVGAPAIDGVNISWGGFAELGIARDHAAMQADGIAADEWESYRTNQVLPGNFDPRAATMIITWRETFSFITRMGVGQGARVLVVGSGGNGFAYAAHARNLGATAVALVGNDARRQQAEALGVDAYVDYKADDVVDQLQAAGGAFDYIIDAVGRETSLTSVLPCLADGGTLAIYGIDDVGACKFAPQDVGKSFRFFNGGYDEPEAHDRVVAFIQAGQLDAAKFMDLDAPYDLSSINDAFQAIEDRVAAKVLIKLSPA